MSLQGVDNDMRRNSISCRIIFSKSILLRFVNEQESASFTQRVIAVLKGLLRESCPCSLPCRAVRKWQVQVVTRRLEQRVAEQAVSEV